MYLKGCFVSQRYWKMKAIHNNKELHQGEKTVVLYPKDTEKWKQFTTHYAWNLFKLGLFCIPKILKNESNSQPLDNCIWKFGCCFVSQRYWKMKAIHNQVKHQLLNLLVVLYPKDTEKWKQFTTSNANSVALYQLFCIPKILKNEI